MKTIKHFLFRNFKTLSTLTLGCMVSLFLLMIRLKITQSFFLLFLVWNLFLAIIPFCISMYLTQQKQLKKWQFISWTVLWLLFLPNAPYLVTDLIHLQLSDGFIVMIDLVVIVSFASTGLLFYFKSIQVMEQLFQKYCSKTIRTIFFTVLPFLCGFGIYLGRFLRFNSWDILQEPTSLIVTVGKIIIFPASHWFAWGVTMAIGTLLWALQKIIKPKLLTA